MRDHEKCLYLVIMYKEELRESVSGLNVKFERRGA